jgi:hypothetical protein
MASSVGSAGADPRTSLPPKSAPRTASSSGAPDADRLVEDLRRRGHRAYRAVAQVPERGLWHRVRIGPFKSKYEATRYKADFERVERVSPFVVDPDKVKQAEDIRAMRLAAREKKDKKRLKIVVEGE